MTGTNAAIITDFNDIIKSYDPTKNKTNPILSKYERVKLLGLRAEQIQRGATPFVPVDPDKPFDAREIAKRELMEKKVPMMIGRPLPDGTMEYWRLDDMLILAS